MKRTTTIAAALAALLLAGILSGCPGGSRTGSTTESMTFVDRLENPSREFSMNENMEFAVRFVRLEGELGTALEELGIAEGMTISGLVRDSTNGWTDTIVEGTASGMRSSNPTNDALDAILQLVTVQIRMVYTSEGGRISAVTVGFPDSGNPLSEVSAILMGGTFVRR